MKSNWKITLLPLLALSCGGPDSGNPADVAGTGQVEGLGRYVSGTFLLTEDVKYDKACNYFDEQFVREMFEVEATTAITTEDNQTNCAFIWDNKKQLVISTTNRSSFQSIYHAEYYFDSLYQPTALAQRRRGRQDTQFGQYTEDRTAEGPTAGMTNQNVSGQGIDSSAVNDSSDTYNYNSRNARQSVADIPTVSNAIGRAIPDIGDKALWDDRKRTLHVLALNNVFHITVNHSPAVAADLNYARRLALVLIDKMRDEAKGGMTTPPDVPIY
ncbi:hypothetical protein [Larkinella soli]|uniref:hypothetical protein n=1 Tax=Larkinella soli TaxID=1770527 RepID=UPI000FFBDFD5|nr:hypothetical protein [Larkinella soli]